MSNQKILINTERGITAPKGFYAAGLRAGIKAGKTNKDMALIYSEIPAVCAGTFTRNVVKAAPVLWDRDIVENYGLARAVVINSGIANACTGKEGYENCRREAEITAGLLSAEQDTAVEGPGPSENAVKPDDSVTGTAENAAKPDDSVTGTAEGAAKPDDSVTETAESSAKLDDSVNKPTRTILKPEQVLVSSTGVIGPQLNMEVIEKGIKMLVPAKADTDQAAHDAAEAILTTDTHRKEVSVRCQIGGKTVTFGGMCKGAGMIHPNMGTMLAFVTSDAAIDGNVLKSMLKSVVEDTFNMVSVDGDTSTNDTCLILCNGMAGNAKLTADDPELPVFKQALTEILAYLSKQIAGDGEGCTRLFEVTCNGAASKQDARIISKSVVCSSLTKAAVFGKDANWGRILCAMGYSGVIFDPEKVDIVLESEHGSLTIVKDGIAADYSEEYATQILSGNPVKAILDIHAGEASATAWGCDLTYEYVKINADYRS